MFRLGRPTSPPLNDDTSDNNNDDFQKVAATCRQQASLVNSSRKLALHHPNVKIPPRLQEKPIEEQIRRCCDRFKEYPKAVDTLFRALTTIITHPNEIKYRRIDQTHPGYQRCLANVPGTKELLHALGFAPSPSTNPKILILSSWANQETLLRLALRVLDQTKQSPEYQRAKKEQLFVQQVQALLNSANSSALPPEEQTKRQEFLSKLPQEPPKGRAAVMMIQLVPPNDDIDFTTTPAVLTRRFDGDDTLQDVLHWIGGMTGTAIFDKICHTREWCLVDVNRPGPQLPIDCGSQKQSKSNKTLQHLGFWPSGRLALRLRSSLVDGKYGDDSSQIEMMGASRGLGC